MHLYIYLLIYVLLVTFHKRKPSPKASTSCTYEFLLYSYT